MLLIDKPNITLRSGYSDASKVVIVSDNSAGISGSTFKSATVRVTGRDFHAENLTFSNDFNRTHPQLPKGSQALALLVSGDRATFRNMRLLGNQDTLYAGSSDCTPPGTTPRPARRRGSTSKAATSRATSTSSSATAWRCSRGARSTARRT